MTDEKYYYQEVKKVSIVAALANFLLGVFKILIGIMGHSHALIADGVHSFSDLLTDALVIVAARFGSQAADADHPYGHGRIETAATLFLAIFLSIVAVGIMWDALHSFSLSERQLPETMVIWMACASVALNEVLYHYTKMIAVRIKSDLIHANAWHHRSDAASSFIVLLGVLGARLFGYQHLDAIAALIVAVFILKMGWQIAWSSLKELVDTAVEPEIVKKLEEIITAIPDVQELHQLRTRYMGRNILVDVHVLVDPKISVSEGHHISEKVRKNLLNGMDLLTDVTVHIDHEDDELYDPCYQLPSRKNIEMKLKSCWDKLAFSDKIENITIHYLAGSLQIEVHLSLQAFDNLPELTELASDYEKEILTVPEVSAVRVHFIAQ